MRSIGLTYDLSTRLLSFTTPPTGREVIVGTRGDNLGTCLQFTFTNAGSMLNTEVPFCAIGVPIVTDNKKVTSYEEEITKTVTEGVTTWHPIYVPDEVMSSAQFGKMAIQIHMRHNPANSDDFAYEYFSLNMITMEVVPSIPNPIPIQPVLPGESYYVLRTEFVTKMAQLDAKDLELQTNISNEANTRAEADTALSEDISDEATARSSADTTLQANIDDEASARQSADTTLQTNITNEATIRGNADTTLQTNITNEATIRGNADTTLQTNITNEATARTNADNILQANIDAEATARGNADSALQTTITNEATARSNADSGLQTQINGKQDNLGYTPENVTNKVSSFLANIASTSVKYPTDYAVKHFVNSSIATETAYFRGTYPYLKKSGSQTENGLLDVAWQENDPSSTTTYVSNNDYAFAIRRDSTGNTLYDRYKWVKGSTHIIEGVTTSWYYEYSLNNSSFTQAQWDAINSGISDTKVSTYEGYQTQINGKQDLIDNNHKLSASLVSGLAMVATSGSYNDLSNRPTIPTIPDIIIDGGGSETGKAIISISVDANDTHKINATKGTFLTQHQALPSLSKSDSGSGNAVTGIDVNGHAITVTKGATFLTQHQVLPAISVTESGSGNVVIGITASNHALIVTKGSVQTSTSWGNISGTLSDQTDLQNALNTKASTSDIPTVEYVGY